MADASGGLVLRRIREPFPGLTVVDCDGFALSLDDWKDGVTCTVYDTEHERPRFLGVDIRGSFTISGRPVSGPQPESVARLSPLLWAIYAGPGHAGLVLRNGGTILIDRDHVVGQQPWLPPQFIHTRAGLRCHDLTSRGEP